MNDTATPAIRTGLYICQERLPKGKNPTTFCLHAQELVLKHGIGIHARVLEKGKKDTFEKGLNLKVKVKKLASLVMNKKAKGRYQDYVMCCKKVCATCTPNKLIIPNDTRVSGVYLMFQSVLRARWGLASIDLNTEHKRVYTADVMLSGMDWQLLSEFEAVMTYTHTLAMNSQQSYPGEIAFAWVSVADCRWQLLDEDNDLPLKCVDVSVVYPSGMQRADLPVKEIEKGKQMKETREFVERLLRNMERYFPEPDSDMLIAMNLHPLFHWGQF